METKTFTVVMSAFCDGPAYPLRRVVVPSYYINSAQTTDDRAILEAIFHFGQNDFCAEAERAQHLPSVSVNDVALVDGVTYRCGVMGWKRIEGRLGFPAKRYCK